MSSLIPLYDALVSIEVPSDRARAVVDALERDMTANLATRPDLDSKFALLDRKIEGAEKRLDQKIDSLGPSIKSVEAHIVSAEKRLIEKMDEKTELLRSSMRVELGTMLAVATGLLFAALKLT